jgi:hypothetical protein
MRLLFSLYRTKTVIFMNNTIGLTQAKAMTQRYRNERDKVIHPDYHGRNILSNCETFDRQAFDKVLGQEGCVQVRVYFGMGDDLRVRTITVGVDANGNDMLPKETSATGSATATSTTDILNADLTSTDSIDPTTTTTTTDPTDPVIIEEGAMCPPLCPTSSPLNP